MVATVKLEKIVTNTKVQIDRMYERDILSHSPFYVVEESFEDIKINSYKLQKGNKFKFVTKDGKEIILDVTRYIRNYESKSRDYSYDVFYYIQGLFENELYEVTMLVINDYSDNCPDDYYCTKPINKKVVDCCWANKVKIK